ncbi:Protein of unknown function DUF932 [uncultured Caudovirales phage]|uniref:Uncharacterized protein n=1 Tax=uncultured Caudovirales phage TaxID=2100421 RepID=A0A6J5S7L9_9CAUD|nr:Protein of unknown function DUF932 [uncultured Caudovirales phage]CAB4186299.1 Protein of unknown function DUF932 [uncultured Caudovirales phage]CAB4204442.1 Protein of unknown function DUF932 [uncultured Caudovirales phage]
MAQLIFDRIMPHIRHFPYTGTGRWFPQEWFDEMGVAPVHPDITDEQLLEGLEEHNIRLEARIAAEQRERLRIEMEAEEARLAALAARPPLVDRIMTAFRDTMFTASPRPVYRCDIVPTIDYVIPLTPEELDGEAMEPRYRAVPGYIQVLNERTDQIMSIMTDEYEIINDRNVCNRMAELFDAAHLNVDPVSHHVSVGKDGVAGRNTFMEFNLPDMTILPRDINAHQMNIVVTNSFDGTKKERMLVLLRSGNNMNLAFSQHESFAIKHRTGANARLVEQFGQFVTTSVEHNAACIRMLADANANSADSVAEYLNTNRILTGERNAEKLMGRWMVGGTSLNFWSLYQLFVAIITLEYGRNFGAKISKLEQLNADVRNTWPNLLGCPALPRI